MEARHKSRAQGLDLPQTQPPIKSHWMAATEGKNNGKSGGNSGNDAFCSDKGVVAHPLSSSGTASVPGSCTTTSMPGLLNRRQGQDGQT